MVVAVGCRESYPHRQLLEVNLGHVHLSHPSEDTGAMVSWKISAWKEKLELFFSSKSIP